MEYPLDKSSTFTFLFFLFNPAIFFSSPPAPFPVCGYIDRFPPSQVRIIITNLNTHFNFTNI